jgi:hypothetical protein
MKTHLGLGVAVLLSSIAFAQTAPLSRIVTLGTTPLSTNNSTTIPALVANPTYSKLTGSQLPDFRINISPGGATVQGGQSVGTGILITPKNGFNQNLSLSCSGLPSGASCVFGTALAQADGSFIIPMTISTRALTSEVASSTTPFSVPVYTAFPLVVFLLSKRRKASAKYLYQSLGLAILAVASLGWVGCGGASQVTSVTSTITITAQSQSGLSHSTEFQLIVFG